MIDIHLHHQNMADNTRNASKPNTHNYTESHEQESKGINQHTNRTTINLEDVDDALHDHRHSQGHHECNDDHKHQHQQRRSPHQHAAHSHEHKNGCIILYCLFTTVCVWYLQLYVFNSKIYEGFQLRFANYLVWVVVSLSLWSYNNTIGVSNQPLNVFSDKKKYFYRSVPEEYQKTDPIYIINRKECRQCDNYKFPRVSHCNTCSTCIHKLDHHCVWTQNCIGYRNHRSFYLFVIYMTIGCIQYIIATWKYFSFLLKLEEGFFSTHEFGFFALWFFTNFTVVFVGIMLGMLAFTHTLLIMTNTTTLDLIKSRNCFPIPFLEWRSSQLYSVNLYDRGEIRNIMNLFYGSLLGCWMPLIKVCENQFLPQKMNPEPTRRQILSSNQAMLLEESNRQSQLASALDGIDELYKGKKVRVLNRMVTL